MNTTKIKSILLTITVTICFYSVCPVLMSMQSSAFEKRVAELTKTQVIRTLAVIGVK